MSKWQLNMLVKAKHLYYDGTFSAVPHPFKQLNILLDRDYYNDTTIVLCYMLLNSKHEEAYKASFNFLKNILFLTIKKTFNWKLSL